jgi:predicted MFS family arabinose efflux permease
MNGSCTPSVFSKRRRRLCRPCALISATSSSNAAPSISGNSSASGGMGSSLASSSWLSAWCWGSAQKASRRFSAFLDIAYGLAAPAAGLIAGHFGYAAVYLLGAACALLGAALVVTVGSSRTGQVNP